MCKKKGIRFDTISLAMCFWKDVEGTWESVTKTETIVITPDGDNYKIVSGNLSDTVTIDKGIIRTVNPNPDTTGDNRIGEIIALPDGRKTIMIVRKTQKPYCNVCLPQEKPLKYFKTGC